MAPVCADTDIFFQVTALVAMYTALAGLRECLACPPSPSPSPHTPCASASPSLAVLACSPHTKQKNLGGGSRTGARAPGWSQTHLKCSPMLRVRARWSNRHVNTRVAGLAGAGALGAACGDAPYIRRTLPPPKVLPRLSLVAPSPFDQSSSLHLPHPPPLHPLPLASC